MEPAANNQAGHLHLREAAHVFCFSCFVFVFVFLVFVFVFVFG
jgi:hypothetical protein